MADTRMTHRHSDAPRRVAVFDCHVDMASARFVMVLLTACLAMMPATSLAADPAVAVPDSTDLRIGSISLQMDNIFTDEEVRSAEGINRTVRRTLNSLHFKTRPWVVSKELLFESGDPFRPRLLAESERNLRSLGFLNNVAVVPTDTTADGRVNVDVRTRETWTLGAEFSFALAGDGDVRWDASLSDKNFLGYGLEVRGSLGHGLDASYGGVFLKMNRVQHTPLSAWLNLDERSDGHNRGFRVALPFRSDDQLWSASVQVWDQRLDTRWYLSNGGPAGADPAAEERLYTLLPRDREGMQIDLMKRFSDAHEGRIWRLGAGLRISRLDYMVTGNSFVLSDGRVADLSYLDEPGETLARDTGTEVWPYLVVTSSGRSWVETRFLLRYGNAEDIPLDPAFVLQVGPTGPWLGTTSGEGTRLVIEGEYRNWSRLGRSFLLQDIEGRVVLGPLADRHHRLDAIMGAITRIGPEVRPFTIKAFAEGVHSEGLRGDLIPVLGLDRGLRTLGLDGMAGEKLLRWSCEIGRGIDAIPFGLLRMGWGVYYSGGLARWTDESRDLADARHEAGVGLRLGFTRSGTSPVARLDLTRDLSGDDGWVVTTVTGGFF
jgi:hypothetical protein